MLEIQFMLLTWDIREATHHSNLLYQDSQIYGIFNINKNNV